MAGILELFDSLFNLVFDTASGEIAEVNPALCSYLGYCPDEMIGRKVQEFNLLPVNVQHGEVRKKRSSGVLFSAAPYLLKSGEVRLFDVYSSAPLGANPRLLCTTLFDVTDRECYREELFLERELHISTEEKYRRRIEFLSYHDALTGLYNRQYMEEVSSQLNRPQNLPIAVIMGDVNGLKIANDAFGHKAGDKLLKDVAELFQKNCKPNAFIARWGGDELVAFLPQTDLCEAEEIMVQIRNTSACLKERGLPCSLSLGCSIKSSLADSIADTLREAEEFMYRHKLLNGKSYRNAIINTLLVTLYENSNETKTHSDRIEGHCHLIGRELEISSTEMAELSLLAKLHDIGKVGIDSNILKKPGALTAEEWTEMKRHPEIGYRIAQANPELAMVADLILSHHERWDGKGYPYGLKGREIPLLCRILAVADSFDAMTNDRVYRRGMSKEDALREIEKNSGIQFDPEIVSIFLKHVVK
ncbi:MAG: diguanylate cyclase [Lacrimispora sp.]|uniref:sensor domain-containing diguanylate cyclase/phosphohydrolase n=1 Tax=Lacrimispora sp. TaxID=2719234 RepID=UPI0039E64877